MRRPHNFLLLVVGFSIALMTLSDPVHSQYDDEWREGERDHDRARQAVRRGEVLPMARVLERLYARIPGEIVGVEFEREDGRWIYEFKLVDRIGRLLEVQVDAATGNILSTEVD